MKKRLAIYALFAFPLAVFTWYTISSGVTARIVWVISAVAIAVYETRQSGQSVKSALAVTIFWLVGLTIYTLYWAGIVFSGNGGEQLTYLQIGMSPDWLIQDLQFYQHTMLRYLASYGLFALMVGPLLGAGTGWFLQQRVLQKIQQ